MDEMAVSPMTGGDGLHSYSKNSTLQRKVIESTKELINKAVEKFDIKTLSLSKTIKIADLGCSTGPNTFIAMQNIIDSLEHKFHDDQGKTDDDINESDQAAIILEFQVFFNDLTMNDFNQLFASLPRARNYFAAGVPGSFYGPLFPKDSLHFVHSSSAVHWLSRVPEEVVDKSSPAWNKGRIFYSNSTYRVLKAYEAQFSKDMNTFLKFRAQEIVAGGLMALIINGRANEMPHSKVYSNKALEQLESALIDMAKEGRVSNEKIDSFNIPEYHATPEEVESAVKRSGCFTLETMEIVTHQAPPPMSVSSGFRAALEGSVIQHFGVEILDDLFGVVLPKKLGDLSASATPESLEFILIFVLLVKK